MKTFNYFKVMLAISIITWSCTNNEISNEASVKTSMESGVIELSTSLNAIANSEGYQVLSISSINESSSSKVLNISPLVIDSTFNSIVLADIAGVWDYKAISYKKGPSMYMRYFTKTAASDKMVLRLPEEKAKRPKILFQFTPTDTLLANNYIISLSKYDYKFNRFLGWDYTMASTINVKAVDAGALNIQSSSSKASGYKYASEFIFTDGNKINTSYSTGDTAISIYSISNAVKTLYEEKFTAIKTSTENKHRERLYTLTVGDVKIVREPGKNGLDSAKVYLNGVLQLNSKVEIIDIVASTDPTDNSVIQKKRELKITFDDGTSKTMTELLGTSVDLIRQIFTTLRQSTFAVDIVDAIAWDVYKNK